MRPRYPFALLCLVLLVALPVSAQVLPGQIIVDPEHPQWLMRAGGKHVFIAGPGDPEGFLYRGTRLSDGTRNGDQDELLDTLIAEGGNCLYLQVVRSHGGDGAPDHNPFVASNPSLGLDDDILDQWEGWFDRMEAAGILIYLFVYDDSASIWSTGNFVGAAEQAFLAGIVDRFEHHGNLIWIVAEESEEAFSHSRVRRIAEAIADADDHDHIIGNHHHPGTAFAAWEQGSALGHYSMQLDISAANVHAQTLVARGLAEAAGSGDGYFVISAEAAHVLNASLPVVRDFLWDTAMAGVMPMIFGIDIAQDTAALNACRILQQFLEATDIQTMTSRDDLAHAGTDWVLAVPPRGYIAYAAGPAGDLGLRSMSAGHYDLLWVDAVDGTSVSQSSVALPGGDVTLPRPAGIGGQCAVWLSRRWLDLAGGTNGINGEPVLSMDGPLTPGSLVTLDLERAASGAAAYIFVSFGSSPASFLGGTLHAFPIDALAVETTNAAGEFHGVVEFPGGPSGASLWFQVGVVDPTVPLHGASLSNGVRGTIP